MRRNMEYVYRMICQHILSFQSIKQSKENIKCLVIHKILEDSIKKFEMTLYISLRCIEHGDIHIKRLNFHGGGGSIYLFSRTLTLEMD